MKKTLSVIGSFCLGISLSIAVIACANDNDHTTPLPEINVNDCVPTILSYDWSEDLNFNINFNYDDNGRLTGAKSSEDIEGGSRETSYNISYSGTTITIVEEANNTDAGWTYTYTHTITVSEDDIVNVQAYNLALFLTVFDDFRN